MKKLIPTIMILSIFVSLFRLSIAAEVDMGTPVHFRYAGAEIPEWKNAGGATCHGEQAPDNGCYPITWQYPVFQGPNSVHLDRLNAWTRNISTPVFIGEADSANKALGMKDSEIASMLRNDKDVRETSSTQSVLVPDRIFGHYIFFTLYSSWLGLSRPQHSVETFLYDYIQGQTVHIKTFFRDDAIEELNGLLEKAITEEFNNAQAAYEACLKRQYDNNNVRCEKELEIDHLEYCVSRRDFKWERAQLHSSQSISIIFPYDPAEFSACGDGGYVLEGEAVKKILKTPDLFLKERLPIEEMTNTK